MKKLLLLVLVLALVGCGSQASEVAYLEEMVASLEEERDMLVESVADLQTTIAQMEARNLPWGVTREEVLRSFRANLPSVVEFLGINEIYVAEGDIWLQRNSVIAFFDWDYSDRYGQGRLIFYYRSFGGEVQWFLLQYFLGPINGRGFLDAGRSRLQWTQQELFDENFAMRFYRYSQVYPEPIYEYFDVEIEYEDWQAQVIYHMQAHTDIRLADLWYEGNRLVVDLTPAATIPFFSRWSDGRHIRTLITSISTMPDVTEIEVLVDGRRGIEGDGFWFGTFRVN